MSSLGPSTPDGPCEVSLTPHSTPSCECLFGVEYRTDPDYEIILRNDMVSRVAKDGTRTYLGHFSYSENWPEVPTNARWVFMPRGAPHQPEPLTSNESLVIARQLAILNGYVTNSLSITRKARC